MTLRPLRILLDEIDYKDDEYVYVYMSIYMI